MRITSIALAFLAALLPLPGAASGQRVALAPFDFRGVALLDSPLKRQIEADRDFYLRIPANNLLKGFRVRAGRPAPGHDLGGWYSDDTFHIFGQVISGLARMYAATGDPDCRVKAHALIVGWAECIGPDGYFYYSGHPNAPHYIYDKMVGGMLDAAIYCHDPAALPALRRITGWAVTHLDRSRPFQSYSDTEWYTLSENLYRAYVATHDTLYRDFARVWEYTPYWQRYAEGADIFNGRPGDRAMLAYHAYSHVNTLGGLGAGYLATGDRRRIETLKRAYDYLQSTQCFATGGYGPDESLLPAGELEARLDMTHNSYETQCGTWAEFKVARYLTEATGEARYGDWVERLIFDAMAPSLPPSSDGHVFYSDYNPSGATKTLHPPTWTCCAGTQPMALADIANQIYYRKADDLYVAQFVPSRVNWSIQGVPETVELRTRFPESEVVVLDVRGRQPARFRLSLRRPAWLAGAPTVAIDGRKGALGEGKSGWLTLDRVWRGGDRVVVRLPMAFRWARLRPERPWPAALMRGPVVMTARTDGGYPMSLLALRDPAHSIVAAAGEPGTFRVAGDAHTRIRPFYAAPAREIYYLYLNPAAARRIPYREVRFEGDWHDAGVFRYSDQPGAMAEATFDGTGVRWLGQRFDDGGTAQATIDGRVVGRQDQYGPGRGLQFDYIVTGLPPGRHTTRLRVLDTAPAGSKGRFINVAGFEEMR